MAFRFKPDQGLFEFATETEATVLEAAIELGSFEGVAAKLELDKARVRDLMYTLRRRAARKGYVPEHGLTKALPDGQHLQGATIQRDSTGKIERTWTKSWKDRNGAAQAFIDAVERAGESCKGIAGVTPAPKLFREDLCALYGAGDPHFGMQAWHKVAGDDWDLKIAESSLITGLEMLAAGSPPAEEAIFLNAGDMFHADDEKARTPGHGHALDVDNRWSKVLDVVLRTHMRLAKTLLAKHNRVRLIALPGNHDPQSSLVLQVCLKLMFADEPRVTVDTTREIYTHYRFGKGLMGFHHGHGAKMSQLPLIMATKWKQDWAAAEETRIYTGHRHVERLESFMGHPVEVLPTLAAADKYAADNFAGLAQRSILCDTWHKELGRVQRNKTHFRHIKQ